MLSRKELTPMQRCRNTYYHEKYGMSDQTKWFEHQYYSNGAPKERKSPGFDDDFWKSGLSTEMSIKRRNKAAEEEKRRKEEIASQRNYNFLKAIQESKLGNI